jgi:hypothetical protein
MTEARLRHADHRVHVHVDAQGPADHVRVGPEAAAPQAVADHDDRRDPRAVVLRTEQATELGAGAQDAEVIGARKEGLDPLRL